TRAIAIPNCMKPTDIRIRDVSIGYDHFLYRTPIKFGGVALDRATILNVRCVVETRDNRTANGFGSMPLGNVWAWPTKSLTYDQTLYAMQVIAGDTAGIYCGCPIVGHPIDITHAIESELLAFKPRAATTEPMPVLAKMVVASPFD